MQLYELVGADPERRFSPYCWRSRMALAHKGLEATCIPFRFTDKALIAGSGQGRVPVLVDDGEWISDSWTIACHLEDRYPDRPSLFGGAIGRAEARFINVWADATLVGGIFPLVVADIWPLLDPVDQGYFRETREARLGKTLEEASADRDQRVERFAKSLLPLRVTLGAQPFIAGEAPAYADYIAFGAFQWARCISDFKLLAADDPIYDWRGRMLELYDGLAADAVGYEV